MKTKVKSIIQRIMAGSLALVFVGTIALPKAEAVTGVDDVSVGIMALMVHLDSIGGSLAVQQGTALATTNACTALAEQAAMAGVFGSGVTGAGALATIGGAVTVAAAGGFTIGYVGYETLSKLAEWIRQARATGTAENKIYQTGGSYTTKLDGTSINTENNVGKVYTTQAGSSYVLKVSEVDKNVYNITMTAIDVASSGKVLINIENDTNVSPWYGFNTKTKSYRIVSPSASSPNTLELKPDTGHFIQFSTNAPLTGIFLPPDTPVIEKQEVTYVPPVTWSPPAPTLGQDVYYNPYPQMPQKPLKEIVEDVPKDIYDKKFDPAPPSILDPSIPPIEPPAPDIPPVNPNPDVTAPDDVRPYTVRLGDVFPFCIPFDIYHMVTLFAAEPEAPHAKWEFSLPFTGGTYEIEWDLREWDEVAALCRKLQLILFCVGLAVVTSKLIKW